MSTGEAQRAARTSWSTDGQRGSLVTATDLFAGAGGSSTGLEQAGCRVLAAANHWPTAVRTHQENHPDAVHHTANLSETDFRVFPSTSILWASPSCVWHARAGGRKRPPAASERLMADAGAIDRATAFAVIAATEVHRYPAIVVENVPEFTRWSLFPWWLDGLRALGYRVQDTLINAVDLGEAQSRTRWFGIFTQGAPVDLTLPVVEHRHADQILDPDPADRADPRLRRAAPGDLSAECSPAPRRSASARDRHSGRQSPRHRLPLLRGAAVPDAHSA